MGSLGEAFEDMLTSGSIKPSFTFYNAFMSFRRDGQCEENVALNVLEGGPMRWWNLNGVAHALPGSDSRSYSYPNSGLYV
jgi:hypothetical protein